MNLKRSRAYGRVMRGLESRSALDRLSSEEREKLREAADTLALAPARDEDARSALAIARTVLVGIRRDQVEPWIEQLADDLEDAGPAPIEPSAISPHTREGTPVKRREESASR